MTSKQTPVTFDARARLRDQQRRENDLLGAVLASETKLDAQRARHEKALERADADLANVQQLRDDRVVALIEVGGISRTAALLGTSENELTRLTRGRGKRATRSAQNDGTRPGV